MTLNSFIEKYLLSICIYLINSIYYLFFWIIIINNLKYNLFKIIFKKTKNMYFYLVLY